MEGNKTNSSGKVAFITAIICIVLCIPIGILIGTQFISAESPVDRNNNNTTNDNNSNGSEVASIYDSFLNNSEFLNDYDGTYNEVTYAYLDIDVDGNNELLIQFSEDESDFSTTLIYSVSNQKVNLLHSAYHYHSIAYNKNDKALVYSETNTSEMYGYEYDVCVLNNNSLSCTKTIGYDAEEQRYFKENNTITKAELESYLNSNAAINFEK